MTEEIIKIAVPAAVAFAASIVTAIIGYLVASAKLAQEIKLARDKLEQDYKLEYSLERAIRKIMERGFKLRSFSLLRYHVRGLSDDDLRKALIRSGCICFRVIKDVEYWGLLHKNEELLPTKEEQEAAGKKFHTV
jgi:hypothetical protein